MLFRSTSFLCAAPTERAGRSTSCAASTSSSSRAARAFRRCAACYKNEDCILFRPDLRRWAEKFRAIYTLDSQVCEGWETGLVTTHISKVPFDSFGDDYAVIIVGPPVMMHFCGLECKKLGIPDEKIWVSFERKMSCAVGKCGHCRIDETYVCLEGPVFNYTVAKDLLD